MKKQELMLSSLSYYHPIRYALARKNFIEEVIKSLPASFNSEGDFIFNFSIDKYRKSYDCFVNGRVSHSKVSLAKDLYSTAIRRIYATINRMSLEGKYKERDFLLDFIKTANDDDYSIFKQLGKRNNYS